MSIKFDLVAGYDDFCELVDWLDREKSHQLVGDFDNMLSWPTIILNGLFIHMGWMAEANLDVPNWERWEIELRRAWEVAKARKLSTLGCEFARALSVIFSEKLSSLPRSLTVLDQAEIDFEPSIVLAEQRSNAYFQARQYPEALAAWEDLENKFGSTACIDANAYRRAALAASKVERWALAAKYFEEGVRAITSPPSSPTRCGFLAEAALANHLAGRAKDASAFLTMCFDALPADDATQNSKQWEAALRAFCGIAMHIRGHQAVMTDGAPAEITLGMASNPLLTINSTDTNHVLRMSIFELDVRLAAVRASGAPWPSDSRLLTLLDDVDPMVRWLVSLNLIAFELETASTAWLPKLVETSHSTAEHMRQQTPFANMKKDSLIGTGGLYVLAAICDARTLDELLALWETNLPSGYMAASKEVLSKIRAGSARPHVEIARLLLDAKADTFVRCGAALAILKSVSQDARSIAVAQTLLVVRIQESGALASMKGMNIDTMLASRFATNWKRILNLPQLAKSPAQTIEPLLREVTLALAGQGNLRRLLLCGASAGGMDIAHVLEKYEF